MLTDSQRSYLRYLSVLYGDRPESGKASFYPAFMRMRMNEIKQAAPPAGQYVFKAKWMRTMTLIIVLAIAIPVSAIFFVVGDDPRASMHGFAAVLGATGIALAAAIWLCLGPLFTSTAVATDAQLKAAPPAAMDGDEAIVARSRMVMLVACLLPLGLFGVMAVVMLGMR